MSPQEEAWIDRQLCRDTPLHPVEIEVRGDRVHIRQLEPSQIGCQRDNLPKRLHFSDPNGERS